MEGEGAVIANTDTQGSRKELDTKRGLKTNQLQAPSRVQTDGTETRFEEPGKQARSPVGPWMPSPKSQDRSNMGSPVGRALFH
jgi:hypothetical protein